MGLTKVFFFQLRESKCLPSSCFRTAYDLGSIMLKRGFGAEVFWHQGAKVCLAHSLSPLVHPLSAIPGSTMARDLVLIILEVKLIVICQLKIHHSEGGKKKQTKNFIKRNLVKD